MKKAKIFFMTLAGIFSKAAFRVVFGVILVIFVMKILEIWVPAVTHEGHVLNMLETHTVYTNRTRIKESYIRTIENIVLDSHVLENITVAQLRGLVFAGAEKFRPELYMELFSVPLENHERMGTHRIFMSGSHSGISFSSAESAINKVTEIAREQNWYEWSYEFIGENDYFYQLRVLSYSSPRSVVASARRIFFFKDSAVTFYPHGITIHKTDAEDVENLLDLLLRFGYLEGTRGILPVIHLEFHETDDYFQYIVYTIGDMLWNLNHRATLIRRTWVVDRTDGTLSRTDMRIIKETNRIM